MATLRRLKRRAHGSLFVSVIGLALLSCASAGERNAGSLPIASTLSRDGSATFDSKWWLALADDQLAAHIDEALTKSYSLAAVWARLDQARADAREAGADLLPNLNAELDGSVRRTTGSASAGLAGETWSAGVAASYEIDLWGALRSQKNAAQASFRAAQADLDAAAVTLSAEVAIAWYRWVEATQHHLLRQEQTATNEQILALVEARYSRGQVSAQDVFRQRQVVDAAKHAEVVATSEATRWRNRLSTLVAKEPSLMKMPAKTMLPVPSALPALGQPIDIIARRPDLRAALERLRAADATAAAAVANRFPRLSLRASVATSTESASDLFRNWLFSVGGNLLAPLFDGGRLKARADSARSAAQVAWFGYAQAALNAIAEIEDALVQDAELLAETESLTRQLEFATRGLEIAQAGYVAGRATYLQTLDAVTTLQTLERSLLTSRRETLEARINLHRAVAGPVEQLDRARPRSR